MSRAVCYEVHSRGSSRPSPEEELFNCAAANTLLAGYSVEYYVTTLKGVLAKGTNPDHRRPSTGQTATMIAVQHNNVPGLKVLMAAQANVNIQDKQGETALHFAVMRNAPAMVELLLQHGADATITNNAKRGALDIAKDMQHQRIVALLAANDEVTIERQRKEAADKAELKQLRADAEHAGREAARRANELTTLKDRVAAQERLLTAAVRQQLEASRQVEAQDGQLADLRARVAEYEAAGGIDELIATVAAKDAQTRSLTTQVEDLQADCLSLTRRVNEQDVHIADQLKGITSLSAQLHRKDQEVVAQRITINALEESTRVTSAANQRWATEVVAAAHAMISEATSTVDLDYHVTALLRNAGAKFATLLRGRGFADEAASVEAAVEDARKLIKRRSSPPITVPVQLHETSVADALTDVCDAIDDHTSSSNKPQKAILRLIPGKGLHSPGGNPVIKPKVQQLLTQRGLAWREEDGNAGVLLVTLP